MDQATKLTLIDCESQPPGNFRSSSGKRVERGKEHHKMRGRKKNRSHHFYSISKTLFAFISRLIPVRSGFHFFRLIFWEAQKSKVRSRSLISPNFSLQYLIRLMILPFSPVSPIFSSVPTFKPGRPENSNSHRSIDITTWKRCVARHIFNLLKYISSSLYNLFASR